MALAPRPLLDVNSRAAGIAVPRSRAPRTIAAAMGCSDDASTLDARASSASRCSPSLGMISARCMRPVVRVPVLSNTTVSIRRERSSTSGLLISTPQPRPAAGAGHDRGGRRETHRARAGDDQHRHRRHQPLGRVPRGEPPARERPGGNHQNRRNEDASNPIGEALNRRLARLRAFDQADDLAPARYWARPRSRGSSTRPRC